MAINGIGGGSNVGPFELHKSTAEKQKSMMRLATGLRMLSAGDDAAGMAIGNEMQAELRSLGQAARNANDGISLTQTADGAMGEIGGMLGRMRELGVQAANGTLNDAQRATIDKEYQSLKSEIDRISETTEFNGRKLLDGSEGSVAIQAGVDPGADGRVDVSLGSASAASLGVDSSSLATADSALAGLAALDGAIESLSSRRVDLGAAQNRLGATLENLGTQSLNLEDARARIEDADIAAEVSKMVAADVRSQAGAAVQAQGNQSARAALNLL